VRALRRALRRGDHFGLLAVPVPSTTRPIIQAGVEISSTNFCAFSAGTQTCKERGSLRVWTRSQ
jgi:hypothetical protein